MQSERENIARHRKARKVFQVDVVNAGASISELNVVHYRWVVPSVMKTVICTVHVHIDVSR